MINLEPLAKILTPEELFIFERLHDKTLKSVWIAGDFEVGFFVYEHSDAQYVMIDPFNPGADTIAHQLHEALLAQIPKSEATTWPCPDCKRQTVSVHGGRRNCEQCGKMWDSMVLQNLYEALSASPVSGPEPAAGALPKLPGERERCPNHPSLYGGPQCTLASGHIGECVWEAPPDQSPKPPVKANWDKGHQHGPGCKCPTDPCKEANPPATGPHGSGCPCSEVTNYPDECPHLKAKPPVTWAFDLWKHLADEHNLLLLETEIADILAKAEPLVLADVAKRDKDSPAVKRLLELFPYPDKPSSPSKIVWEQKSAGRIKESHGRIKGQKQNTIFVVRDLGDSQCTLIGAFVPDEDESTYYKTVDAAKEAAEKYLADWIAQYVTGNPITATALPACASTGGHKWTAWERAVNKVPPFQLRNCLICGFEERSYFNVPR